MRHVYVRNPVRLFVSEVNQAKSKEPIAVSLEKIADKLGPDWKHRFSSKAKDPTDGQQDKSFKRKAIQSELSRWRKFDYIRMETFERGYIAGLIDLMDIWMRNNNRNNRNKEFTFRNPEDVVYLAKSLRQELEKDTDEAHAALCGIWQIVRRSLRHEHRTEDYVRVGGMIVYGIERGSDKPLLVLLIGPRGVLLGKGWIDLELDKFFLHVEESRDEAAAENQSLIFHLPPHLKDRYVRSGLKTIVGMFFAAIAGQGYRKAGRYPIVATKCVATKMKGDASEWLEQKGWRLDDDFVNKFRDKFLCKSLHIEEALKHGGILDLDELIGPDRKLPGALVVD